MKFSSVILAVFALVSTGLADKTCTPSFDYCSDALIKSKGELLAFCLKFASSSNVATGFTEVDAEDSFAKE